MKKSILIGIAFLFSVVLFAQNEENKFAEIVTVNAQSYEREVASGLVLVDYWAVWCGPCRKMEPLLKEVAAETEVKVGKLNVDENKTFVKTKGVSTIPTMILYKEGREVERIIGVKSKKELLEVFEKYK